LQPILLLITVMKDIISKTKLITNNNSQLNKQYKQCMHSGCEFIYTFSYSILYVLCHLKDINCHIYIVYIIMQFSTISKQAPNHLGVRGEMSGQLIVGTVEKVLVIL